MKRGGISGIAALTRVVALSEPGTYLHGVIGALGGSRWPELHSLSIAETERYLAVKGANMVVVAGSNEQWLLKALAACRRSGRFPLAALCLPGEELSRRLIQAGATVVINPLQGAEDITAQLRALCDSTAPVRSLDVRWLTSDGLRVDLGAHRCSYNGERIPLSTNEFELLQYLMSNAHYVMPAGRITADLWNTPGEAGLNMLRLNIARLRKKLSSVDGAPKWIESVRGVGYQFIRPVAEVGQERSEERLRYTLATLNTQNDGLYDLIDSLRAARSTAEIAVTAVEWATGRGFSDAATVFRFEMRRDRQYSTLVSSAGMSTRWHQAISHGHPVDEGFIASAAYLRGDVIQLADMSQPGGRFPVTVSMSSAEDLHACLIFPLVRNKEVWGDIGFLSKERRAFPPSRVRYLRAAADMISLTLSGPVPDEEAER